ncbi:hypothetical protein V2A60_010253 [Cordyceps javanica]|uniref:Uncharacterized protein n=1 Tax=Cordyceps javanica TaxID=43265 RepID=A0A545VUD2_9HYPO|nr:hypothetical protein IF1G_07894 [Cordyceps javanica]TQW05327.1 hypothetical protein IF2G_07264 [Cordyceps javanica]
MKLRLVLSLLSAAALAAPEQQHEAMGTKLFKEPATNRSLCEEITHLESNPDVEHPPMPNFTEDCVGTVQYCHRKNYEMQGEDFPNPAECFRSRGKDIKDFALYSILKGKNSEFDRGRAFLQHANVLYNRKGLTALIRGFSDTGNLDASSAAAIEELWISTVKRENLALEKINVAKNSFGLAVEDAFAAKINDRIDDAAGKLKTAWDQILVKNCSQLANLRLVAETEHQESNIERVHKELEEANRLYNYRRAVTLISRQYLPQDVDVEGDEAIAKLSALNGNLLLQVEESLNSAKRTLEDVFGSKGFEAMSEALGQLDEAWDEIVGVINLKVLTYVSKWIISNMKHESSEDPFTGYTTYRIERSEERQ